MAIRTVVTDGFGNGTFNGTIPLVVTEGYLPAVVIIPPFVDPDIELVATDVEIGVLRSFIETNGGLLLESLNLQNIWAGQLPPIVTQEDFMNFLFVPSDEGPLGQGKLENWSLVRKAIRHPDVGSNTQYTQVHVMQISGLVWHHEQDASRRYMNLSIQKIVQTLERNKGLVLGGGAEITRIDSRANFGRFGDVSLYQCQIDFDISVIIHERAGRSY